MNRKPQAAYRMSWPSVSPNDRKEPKWLAELPTAAAYSVTAIGHFVITVDPLLFAQFEESEFY